MRCWVSKGAEARARWEAGVLRCSGHGGGEVAAARSFWAAWRREGRSSAKEEGVEELLCDAWKLAGGRAAQSGGRAAHGIGGEREQRETDRGRGKETHLQFPKFPGT